MIDRGAYYLARSLERAGRLAEAKAIYFRLVQEPDRTDPKALFRLGHVLFSLDEYESSKFYIEKAISRSPQIPEWHYRLGFVNEKLSDYGTAARNYAEAVNLRSDIAQWHFRRGRVLSHLGDHDAASNSYQHAVELDTDKSKYHEALAQSIRRQSATSWRELEVLEGGASLHRKDPEWQLRLAQVLESLNRFKEAASSFEAASLMQPDRAFLHYRLGYALQQAGETVEAEHAYRRAVECDEKLGSGELGVGVFHEARGLWKPAVDEYIKVSDRTRSFSRKLYERIAHCFEKLGRWNDALAYRKKLVESDPNSILQNLKVARLLELTNAEKGALSVYASAFARDAKISNYWRLRYAELLERHKFHVLAAENFLIAAGHDPRARNMPTFSESQAETETEHPETSLKERSKEASDLEKLSNIYLTELGSKSSASALERLDLESLKASAKFARFQGNSQLTEELTAEIYHRDNSASRESSKEYALALYHNGLSRESSAVILSSVAARRRNDIHTIRDYPAGKWTAAVLEYYGYLDTLPVEENVVLYESHSGTSVDCNPYAIYRNLIQDTAFSKLIHVWVATKDCEIPDDLKNNRRVRIVAHGSSLYRRYLATAKYLINNVTFQNYFIRRSEQQYLNTWHGTPFKTLGKDMGGTVLQHSNVARNFLQSTHILSPDSHTTDVLTRGYDVKAALTAKIAELGYPRFDLTVNVSAKRKLEIRAMLGIDDSIDAPVVLYAPTWRGEVGESKFEIDRLESDLLALSESKAQVLFRAHPISESLLQESSLAVGTVPRSINSNELLGIVDAVITDYSSIAVDALSNGIPTYLYTYDLDQYRDERGLYFEPDALTDYVYNDIDSLVEAINSRTGIGHQPTLRSGSVASELLSRALVADGHSARRAIEFFFNNSERFCVQNGTDARFSILIRASLIPNGVTSSLLNLLRQIDSSKFVVTLLVDAAATADDEARLSQFRQIPSHVHVIGRTGPRIPFEAEKWQESLLSHQHNLWSDHSWNEYFESFNREYKRIFGSTEFDFVIEYDGYSLFWESLLAVARPRRKALIYLHSEMYKEWKTRASYLEGIFRIYPKFDELVCVSDSIAAVNADEISTQFSLDPSKFVGGGNFVDLESVLERSQEPVDSDVADWIGRGEYLVSVGRISPEKDQLKLVSAFRKVVDSFPEARLILVGDGPQAASVESRIRNLGLSSNVFMAGFRSNPFPIMSNSSGFVLSSNHEGQPMVLLEALALKVPVVSTDIAGTRSLLGDSLGYLVDNSVDGLFDGISRLLSGAVLASGFDVEEYNSQLYRNFESTILGIEE